MREPKNIGLERELYEFKKAVKEMPFEDFMFLAGFTVMTVGWLTVFFLLIRTK